MVDLTSSIADKCSRRHHGIRQSVVWVTNVVLEKKIENKSLKICPFNCTLMIEAL